MVPRQHGATWRLDGGAAAGEEDTVAVVAEGEEGRWKLEDVVLPLVGSQVKLPGNEVKGKMEEVA